MRHFECDKHALLFLHLSMVSALPSILGSEYASRLFSRGAFTFDQAHLHWTRRNFARVGIVWEGSCFVQDD
jgi:hypothetical protein